MIEKPYAIERFSQFVSETTTRLQNLEQFLNQAVLDLEDANKVNQKLIEANRPNLIMNNRAEFQPIIDKNFPTNRRNLPIFNNFNRRILNFHSSTGSYTTEEFLKAKTWPPEQRLLTLYPNFYIPLFEETLKERFSDFYEPEIYVAYQIVSKLVDLNDDNNIQYYLENEKNEDGTLSRSYLFG